MSLKGLVFRFAGVYLGLIILIAIGFSLAGATPNSGANAGALVGAAFFACLSFANRNKRYLDASEKNKAIWGMWAVDMLLQVLVLLATSSGAALTGTAILLALGFVGLLHLAALYFSVRFAGNQYAKQVEKQAAKAAAEPGKTG